MLMISLILSQSLMTLTMYGRQSSATYQSSVQHVNDKTCFDFMQALEAHSADEPQLLLLVRLRALNHANGRNMVIHGSLALSNRCNTNNPAPVRLKSTNFYDLKNF